MPNVEDELNFKPLIVRCAYGSYSTYITDINKRMHTNDENGYYMRLRIISCLITIFFIEQMLFQFSINDFIKFLIVMIFGLFIGTLFFFI